MNLVSFRNRLLVLLQWAFHYFNYDAAARLITTPAAEVSTAVASENEGKTSPPGANKNA
jgi:hypothetical protein